MDDSFETIEALVLGVARPPPTEVKMPAEDVSPLVRVFQEKDIRILGTVDEPLFCAADVASYIDDVEHYNRKISRYTQGEYLQLLTTTTLKKQQRQMQYLTEAGLYKYLLQSKGEKAEEFQRFVYKLLKDERKRTVDSIQLALKIAQTKADELQREKVALVRKQSVLYTAANDARETVAKQAKEIRVLKHKSYVAADAEEMRLCGRQVEQIKGWNC